MVQQDVSKEEDWRRAIDAAVTRFSKLDIVVNVAGVGAAKNFEDITLQEWHWVMSMNLDGVFLGTKYAIQAMKSTGEGSIANMSSIEGLVGDRRMVAYDASNRSLRTLNEIGCPALRKAWLQYSGQYRAPGLHRHCDGQEAS